MKADTRAHAAIDRKLSCDVDNSLPDLRGDSFGARDLRRWREALSASPGPSRKVAFAAAASGRRLQPRYGAEACGFRRNLVPFGLRRRLGGFCVGNSCPAALARARRDAR